MNNYDLDAKFVAENQQFNIGECIADTTNHADKVFAFVNKYGAHVLLIAAVIMLVALLYADRFIADTAVVASAGLMLGIILFSAFYRKK